MVINFFFRIFFLFKSCAFGWFTYYRMKSIDFAGVRQKKHYNYLGLRQRIRQAKKKGFQDDINFGSKNKFHLTSVCFSVRYSHSYRLLSLLLVVLIIFQKKGRSVNFARSHVHHSSTGMLQYWATVRIFKINRMPPMTTRMIASPFHQTLTRCKNENRPEG